MNEWKSIEKDGFPEDDVRYIIFFENEPIYNLGLFTREQIINNINDNSKVKKITHYFPVQIPPIKEKKKLLNFVEALRVVLDGGKVRRKGWDDEINYLHLINDKGQDKLQLVFRKHFQNCEYNRASMDYHNDWIIVEPAPKPKMPEKLKEFKDELYKTKFIWLPRFPGDALCKLSSFLEDYADE